MWVLIAYMTVFGPLSPSIHMQAFMTFDRCEAAGKVLKTMVDGNGSKNATVYTECVKQ